jgi:hypothetical protein
MAKSAGVTVLVDGFDLVLENGTDPPPHLVAMFRRFEPEIVSALRMRQAEQRSLIAQGINERFKSSPAGVCARCGKGARAEDSFVRGVTVFTGSFGRWLPSPSYGSSLARSG